jgi:beta-glucosidase
MEPTPVNFMSMLSGNKEKPFEEQVPNVDYTKYEEGIYVGYRHFDKSKLEVSYPFGYGLSYTDFSYNDLVLELAGGIIEITAIVENAGPVPGKEVVEIYVSKPDSKIDRPVQELKAFAKTPLLNSGESAELKFRIPVSDLSYWSEDISDWTLEEGTYIIHAAASSRDVRLSKEVEL